jgi:hypothetical protein
MTNGFRTLSLSNRRQFVQSSAAKTQPNSDVFSHHRALTVCHLAAIAGSLGRTLRWDPAKEKILNDPQAQAMLSREKRRGFEITI